MQLTLDNPEKYFVLQPRKELAHLLKLNEKDCFLRSNLILKHCDFPKCISVMNCWTMRRKLLMSSKLSTSYPAS